MNRDPLQDRPLDTLTGQVAVVTGGGAGIGRAICQIFAEAGAAVAVVDIDAGRATEVAAELVAGGAVSASFAADVTRPESVEDAVEGAVGALGRIDVLVNNAGVASIARFLEQSLDSWQRDFAVNVDGPFLMTQAVAPIMIRQEPTGDTICRGKIINMSSAAAEMGRPLLAAYGASKAALNHLSKTSAVVLGEFGISTTVLYPGAVEEGMWGRIPTQVGQLEDRSADEIVRAHLETAFMHRFQTAREVAEAALFIASRVDLALNGSVLWSIPHARLL